jgi:uncharacterized protein YhhL (DUF1145 family)
MTLPAETAPRMFAVAGLMVLLLLTLATAALRLGSATWPRVIARTRYSLLLGAILVLLPFVGTLGAPSMLYALFVLDGPGQFASLTCISFLLATTAFATVRIALENGDARLGPTGLSDVSDGRWAWIRRLTIYPLGLSAPLVAAVATYRDQTQANSWTALWIGCGLFAGFCAAWAIWYLLSLVEHLLIPPALIESGLFPTSGLHRFGPKRRLPTEGFWRFVARCYGPRAVGYTRMVDGELQLRPGHAQLLAFWAFLLVVYVVRYLDGSALRFTVDEATAFPVLFHVCTILLLAGVTLAGAAFFLDYYRLPVLWATLAVVFVCNVAFDGDHYYELREAEHAGPPVEYDDVFKKWKFPLGRKRDRTMVVVTCSGGGIQASAWAAKVMTELSKNYVGFHDSIGLMSGVSGGSVATMYYTLYGSKRDNAGGVATRVLPDDRAEAILQDASRSNLEAAAWGFAYPDFLRLVCPALVPSQVDRGWAMEQLWDARLRRRLRGATLEGEPTLRTLAERVREGNTLLPIFNATIVETGQRLLMSPATGGPVSKGETQELPWDFFALFPNADPRVTTAVRLSATFSYVSPICRAQGDPRSNPHRFHIADGGYTDNEGLVTALQAAKYAADVHAHEGKFDRIILIRIVPFPPNPLEAAAPRTGWLFTTFGPLLALNAVRVASQAERGNMEIENYAERADLVAKFAKSANDRSVEFHAITFRFAPKRKRYDPPLSWKLTQTDRAAIDEAWANLDWDLADQGSDKPPRYLDEIFEQKAARPTAAPAPSESETPTKPKAVAEHPGKSAKSR